MNNPSHIPLGVTYGAADLVSDKLRAGNQAFLPRGCGIVAIRPRSIKAVSQFLDECAYCIDHRIGLRLRRDKATDHVGQYKNSAGKSGDRIKLRIGLGVFSHGGSPLVSLGHAARVRLASSKALMASGVAPDVVQLYRRRVQRASSLNSDDGSVAEAVVQ